MKIHDISREISPEIAVWPGDQKFESTLNAKISDGSSVNLSSILMSTHTGTHADAPYHYEDDGKFITEMALEKYMGLALVLEIVDADLIEVKHLDHIDFSRIKRLLFKTKSSQLDNSVWIDDIVPIAPEAVEFLGSQGVQLIGMDAPSVDPVDDPTLKAHHALAKHGIANLENLYLKDVAPGEYELVALPLKLASLDASPVRAILIQQD